LAFTIWPVTLLGFDGPASIEGVSTLSLTNYNCGGEQEGGIPGVKGMRSGRFKPPCQPPPPNFVRWWPVNGVFIKNKVAWFTLPSGFFSSLSSQFRS